MARDNFPPKIIEIAAKRVAYRCSLCEKPTIGPSQENNSAVSNTGVASHICAAAEGGPRYDPSMTAQQRKAIENCIWLCQTHSKLIDTDIAKYTVDYLRKLKQEAEEKAAQLNEGVNTFDRYWRTHKKDVSNIDSFLERVVFEGRYDLLHLILESDSYNDIVSNEIKELFFRYHLIYDAYCARELIASDLDAYINETRKSGIDQLIEHFIALALIPEVEKLVPFCKDVNLVCLANKLISGDLKKIVTGQIENVLPNQKGETIKEYTLSLSCQEHLRIIDESGKPTHINSKKKYFSLLDAAIKLQTKIYTEEISFLDKEIDEDYIYIVRNESVIKQLDSKLQLFFWRSILKYLHSSKEEFKKIWLQIPESVSIDRSLQNIKLAFQIEHDPDKINVDDLVQYSLKNGTINLLIMYLTRCNRSDCLAFLEDHRFLLKRGSALLYLYIDNINEGDKTKIVQDYSTFYKDDFLFQCIRYNYVNSTEKQVILNWLIKNDDKFLNPHFDLYIAILGENKQWDKLFDLEKVAAKNRFTFITANTIAKENDSVLLLKGLLLYKKLIDNKWEQKGLYYNYAVALANLGKTEEAKNNFVKEIEYYQDTNALIYLLRLRLETNDVIDDKYLNRAKTIPLAEAQIIVAVSYGALNNRAEERKYYLRTLLLDDKHPCSGSLFFQYLDEKVEDIDYVEKNSVCVLKAEDTLIRIAIYEGGFLDEITPNNFADCVHCSIDDPSISDLLYHQCGDFVKYRGESYIIEEIISVWQYLSQYSLKMIVQSDNAIAISGNTIEEAVTNLQNILEKSNKNVEKIMQIYNESKIKPPVSFLANRIGKKLIDTYEFMALGNWFAIPNDISELSKVSNDTVFVIGIDSIVYLGIVDFYDKLTLLPKMMCSAQVKNLIVSEVNSEIKDLSSKSNKGSLGFVNGSLCLSELDAEGKRKRHSYLTKIKAFAEQICSPNSYDFADEKGVWGNLFATPVVGVESGTMGLIQNTKGAVLVSDDPFLTTIAHVNSIPHIGLSAFLTFQFNTPSELLQISKKLHSLNFENYLPYFWYEKIEKLIIESNDKVTSRKLVSWLISDCNGDPSDRHSGAVVNLFYDVVNRFGGKINYNHPLTRIGVNHFLRLNPTFLDDQLNCFIKNINKENGFC